MANKKSKKAQQADPFSANQPAGLTINELRGRIAEKAYELYESRGRLPGHVEQILSGGDAPFKGEYITLNTKLICY